LFLADLVQVVAMEDVSDDDDPTGMKAIMAMSPSHRKVFLAFNAALQACVLALTPSTRKAGEWAHWTSKQDAGNCVKPINRRKMAHKVASALKPVTAPWKKKVLLLRKKLGLARTRAADEIGKGHAQTSQPQQPKVFIYESGTEEVGGKEFVEAEALIECYLSRQAEQAYLSRGEGSIPHILFPWQVRD
jgi:hypothetical protein